MKLPSWVSSHNADFLLKFEWNEESNKFKLKAATMYITTANYVQLVKIFEIEPCLIRQTLLDR